MPSVRRMSKQDCSLQTIVTFYTTDFNP
ncbi:protein of unknown function [Methylorubrum extorquens]|uniref:Uncharacterized protein n=1 Tax=Methylorubrum extorquens TaxID=408 RepID=A0A2N9AJ83_METEX|nr:protein of unknown function [Methylorubrum extorquens]